MKNKLWIFLCILGGVLMIIASATGSAVFYQYLYALAEPYVGAEFLPFVRAILTILEYIALYGGISVLVGTFLILIHLTRVGKIIIMIATSFGMFGLIIYAITWAVAAFGIPLDPPVQLILTQIRALFTFNSGMAFTGTVLAVIGRYGVKRSEKMEQEGSTSEEKSKNTKNGAKFCPNCGATLPLKANFCNKCGKNF